MTASEILEKHKPYPLSIHSDRYGGSYSGGDWTCWWGLCPPDEIFSGDVECLTVWEDIKHQRGFWSGLGHNGRAVGVGRTVDEAVQNAARTLKLIE